MSLQHALRPLLTVDGLVALLLLTRDGLPVEMVGYGLRADKLAAEMAGLAAAASRSFRELGLGEPSSQRVTLEGHQVDIFPVEEYLLAVVTDRQASHNVVNPVQESALEPLRLELRGEP